MKAPAIEFAANYAGLLKPWTKSSLYEYMEYPTQDNWNEIYNIVIVNKGTETTVWNAMINYDPFFPNRISQSADIDDQPVWSRIPTPAELRQAIAKMVLADQLPQN